MGVMSAHGSLAEQLHATRVRNRESQALYDEFVAGLRSANVGSGAPHPGDTFPAFALPDAWGRYRSLDALLGSGPLVLSFVRGGWCPYCVHELRAWNDVLPALAEAGGHFAAVSPEVGGRAAMMGRLLGMSGDAELLCDVDLGVALTAGLAFRVNDPMRRRYLEQGLDLAALYGSNAGFLPVPATFVIDQAGVVRFAFADPDFRNRAKPSDVIGAVAALRD